MKEIPIANVYYLLCYAWGWAQERDVAKLREIEGLATAHDLLGKILAGGVNHLVRRGIDRGYLERREDLAASGKACRSRDREARAAIAREGQPVTSRSCPWTSSQTAFCARRLLSWAGLADGSATALAPDSTPESTPRSPWRAAGCPTFSPVPRLDRRTFGLVQIDRNRRLYRFLLSVCRLLHDHLFVDEASGTTRFRDFRRDEAQMWALFEEFVTGFYRREQSTFHVNRGGRRIDWWEAGAVTDDDRNKIPVMEADLLLDGPERRIIMDTKYYTEALGGRRGAGKLRSTNLYQLLAYLRNRQATEPSGARHEGILLYPEVDMPLAADVRLEGFRIQARTIDLGQEWRGIHRAMLQVIEERNPVAVEARHAALDPATSESSAARRAYLPPSRQFVDR